MEERSEETSPSATPMVAVKEEPTEQIGRPDKQGQETAACNEEDGEQRIECTTETQDADARSCLTKCVFCGKMLTSADDSKLLECLHAACSACVCNKLSEHNASVDVDVLESNVLTCDICNITSQVENMIENRFLPKLSDEEDNAEDDSKEVEEKQKCTSCHDDATATSWCVECEEFICENCVMAHQRLKITKDHTIKPKDKLDDDGKTGKKSGKKLPGYVFCTVHPHEQITLFCQTCDTLTCRDCQLHEHRDHKYKFIHEIALETRNSVSTLLKEVSYKRVLLKSAMKVIEDRQVLILEKKKNLVHDITQMVVQLTNAINTRGKLLIMRLNEVCDQKQNTLNEKKVALDQLSKLTDHCIQFVTYALDKGLDVSLLYSKKSITGHLQRIKSRRADIPNPEIPVRIHLSLEKVSDLIKVVSSIGAIVVDGRVYPSVSPSSGSSTPSLGFGEQSTETKPSLVPTNAHHESTIPLFHLPSATLPSGSVQQASYQQLPLHLSLQQQQQQQQQSTQQQPPGYVQHYGHNAPPRSSPQLQQHQQQPQQPHQQRVPYNVSFAGNRLQGSLMLTQRPIGSCHQQVTSSTHPQHQQVQHLEQQHGQTPSLRGLLGSPGFRPTTNHIPYRLPPAYRYPAGGTMSQRALPAHPYSPNGGAQPIRYQQCGLAAAQQVQQVQHAGFAVQQQPAARWHIPQNVNPCVPYYSARQASAPPLGVPVNDAYKITLKNQQPGAAQKFAPGGATGGDNAAQSQGASTPGQAVSSSVPKTPSPIPHQGKTDETEKSLDKFCQKSLNDLMLTIAKLDSNGIVVIPEAQRNQMEAAQVDSSVDETLHSLADNASDHAKNTVSMTKDDPNEDWCAVCMDGGDAVLCCDKCPKVFHLYCHIPSLKSFPHESETWQCMLCTNILDCSDDPPNEKRPNGMTARELRIAQRIVLELYCQYEQSLPFREIVSSEIVEYHRIIKKPIALDVIRDKLKSDHPNHYTDLRQVMADIRLMFKNAFTYNPVESQVYQEARNLEEFFEKLLLKWAPNYAYDDPFLAAEGEEDEEVFPPNQKYRRIISD
ncbi:E3 ubiquitin-protein ligase TRIM33 isoform X2 [Orussus abietinus]|uniref:E3 ubiquitin-protein ligase TRIM33 isoform X2 n=1 Tax=Orussus abietinus TaxID=222816 RepID=UPI000624FEC5|nr:E3 ubiquitin-protein ligase TRIM33 isoform X2 [Orussus abietinus]